MTKEELLLAAENARESRILGSVQILNPPVPVRQVGSNIVVHATGVGVSGQLENMITIEEYSKWCPIEDFELAPQ